MLALEPIKAQDDIREPLLRLSHISKSFGAIPALRDIGFELRSGEVHALVGENGAGKSTLVQIITGAQQPEQGDIELGGETLRHLTPARARQLGIVCVYQHPALFPDLSVAENIALRVDSGQPLKRINWTRYSQRARQLLDVIGADVSPRTPVAELSMPHQQIVEIACALGTNARVLILDEPTAALTQREQRLLFELVKSLRRNGTGIIYVSHRLEEVFALADRVTILRDGRHIRTCPTAELSEASLIQLMVGRDLSRAADGAPRCEKDPIAASPPGREPGVLLSVRGLGCSAKSLHNISFELRTGEILGLAGLVGAGRTELAQTLFGISPADSGDIFLSGQKVVINCPPAAVKHGIAYVPEDRARHGIIREMSIAQNITLAIHDKIFPSGWLKAAAELHCAADYIRALGIKPAEPNERAWFLSGGNQQKVSVARWLATRPQVLLLDEPTQGIDVGAKSEIHSIIRSLACQGLAVLLISSDLPELLALSDRVGVMRSGRLAAVLPGNSDPHQVMSAAFGPTEATQ